ncbi:MAG TPA: hypothetical protein VE545_00450 [Candidatus Dormibacteraeota bacterium]|nr:hypothetical protein [Candidatus Dormibacteraeota bacterium]
MKWQLSAISVVTSGLWATAIIAAAIIKAPEFLTMILLPLLGFASLLAVQAIGRRAVKAQAV